MNPKGSLAERVLQLEGDLYAVKQELRAANHRAARIGAPNNFRLARITNTPSTSDNTFEVIFLDGKFTQAAGVNSPSYTDRQLASRATVYNITGVKLDKDDVIPVYSWSNRFWTYVPDTSESTPGTDFAEYQANVFYDERFIYDSGVNIGTEITGEPGWMTTLGSDLQRQRLAFTSQDGPSIGLTHSGSSNTYAFTDKAYYRLTYTASVLPFWYVNGSKPSPAEDFYFGVEVSSFANLWATSYEFRHVFHTDFEDVGNTTRSFGNVDFGWARTFSVTTFFKIDYSEPATSDTIAIDVFAGGISGAKTDFGVNVADQHMIIQKLFNNTDA